MSGLGKLSIQLELDQIKFQQGMSKAKHSSQQSDSQIEQANICEK